MLNFLYVCNLYLPREIHSLYQILRHVIPTKYKNKQLLHFSMFSLSCISNLKMHFYQKMRIIGSPVEYSVGVQPLRFLLLISVVTRKNEFKCKTIFSRCYTNKQQGNTNLSKGFSRVVAHTHILC